MADGTNTLRVPLMARVSCQESRIGFVDALVANASFTRVTHLLLMGPRLLRFSGWVIPVDQIASCSGGSIILRATWANLGQFPTYKRADWMRPSQPAGRFDPLTFPILAQPADLHSLNPVFPAQARIVSSHTRLFAQGSRGPHPVQSLTLALPQGRILAFELQTGPLWHPESALFLPREVGL